MLRANLREQREKEHLQWEKRYRANPEKYRIKNATYWAKNKSRINQKRNKGIYKKRGS